ncbi:hypothetical protein [Sphingomonas sp. DT-204]|uniref:hypothetical protein n=1 Tax=Sphingomonas sp. DT-204 TaxID=3396166 RepID=UPI003F1B0510
MGLLTMLAAAAAALAPVQAADVPSPTTLTPGTVSVELPAGSGGKPTAADQVFADAVEQALIDKGFTALPGAGHGRYVASVTVTRAARGAVTSDAPVDGASATSGGLGRGVGATLGVTLPSNTSRVGSLMSTELQVRISRRGETKPAWEGRAVTAQVGGTRNDAPATVAPKLAQALFRNFPGETNLSVSVP